VAAVMAESFAERIFIADIGPGEKQKGLGKCPKPFFDRYGKKIYTIPLETGCPPRSMQGILKHSLKSRILISGTTFAHLLT
jgi:hypothetical protein